MQFHTEAAAKIERLDCKTVTKTVTVEGESQIEVSGTDAKSLISGAADRNRTGTTVARREILSLLRLPISPQRHEYRKIIRTEYYRNPIICQEKCHWGK
jgi:hypothetical protein